MQYVLALSTFTKMKKKQKFVTISITIYTCTEVILFYCKTIQMSYSTNGNWTFHPAKQTPHVKQLLLI